MTESEYKRNRYRQEVINDYLSRPGESPDDQLIIKSKYQALQDHLGRPFPSTDDPPPFRTHTFEDTVIPFVRRNHGLVRELPRPGVFSLVNKIDDIGRKVRSTIIEPVAQLFRPRIDLEKINSPQPPIESSIPKIESQSVTDTQQPPIFNRHTFREYSNSNVRISSQGKLISSMDELDLLQSYRLQHPSKK